MGYLSGLDRPCLPIGQTVHHRDRSASFIANVKCARQHVLQSEGARP